MTPAVFQFIVGVIFIVGVVFIVGVIVDGDDGSTTDVVVAVVRAAVISAGLRWGNKENICFWHHRPPALPLGHNCSNPSLRLSA
jgi:hypothetical protein